MMDDIDVQIMIGTICCTVIIVTFIGFVTTIIYCCIKSKKEDEIMMENLREQIINSKGEEFREVPTLLKNSNVLKNDSPEVFYIEDDYFTSLSL